MISLLLESGNHSTGWDRHCPRSIQCGSPTDWNRHICRVASFVGEDQDGQRFVLIEPDAGHFGSVLRDSGLHGIRTKSLCSPGFKLHDKELTLRSREPPLNRQETTMYRSCVLRLAYLAQDRGDFGEPVKCLARSMATPTPGALRDLKKVARYLRDRRHLALRFKQQIFPKCITTFVDSDHAGCKLTRRPITGMVKTTCNLQCAIGFKVSEARYFALCHGAPHGLALKANLRDLGLTLDLEVKSDSSSARSFANRRGLGRLRHVQTRYLWLQKRIAHKQLKVERVATKSDLSHILAKCCG